MSLKLQKFPLQRSIVIGSTQSWNLSLEMREAGKKMLEQSQAQPENPHFVFLGSQSRGVGGGTEKRHWDRQLSSPQIKVNFRALVRTKPNNHPQLLLLLVVLLLPSNTHRSFGGCSEL